MRSAVVKPSGSKITEGGFVAGTTLSDLRGSIGTLNRALMLVRFPHRESCAALAWTSVASPNIRRPR
jgi:hypothetical protein